MIRLPLSAFALIPAMALSTACTPTSEPENAQPPLMGEGACDATKIRDLIGKMRSEDVAKDALARSGANSLRWIAPGTMVTMDYRSDRLNLNTDEKGRIVEIKCG